MPTLPTFDVTQAQADRMLAAYGSVDAYKTWLRDRIIEHVVEFEKRQATVSFVAQQNALEEQIKDSLGYNSGPV